MRGLDKKLSCKKQGGTQPPTGESCPGGRTRWALELWLPVSSSGHQWDRKRPDDCPSVPQLCSSLREADSGPCFLPLIHLYSLLHVGGLEVDP